MKKTKNAIKNLSDKSIKTTKHIKGGNRLRGFGSWSTGNR